MPTHPFYTNFTAGTVSEKLDARVDFERYKNAARVIKNGVVLPQGGVSSRAGTIFLGRAKFTDTRVRLVTFSFSVEQSYVVEFGVGYARFWTDRALVVDGSNNPVEVVTPYSEDDLRELRFEQSADVMYIGHPNHPPAKISRQTPTQFVYSAMNFLPPPTYEPDVFPQADMTLSQTAIGNAQLTITGTGFFLAGDVGRPIRAGVGRAVISAYVSATEVTVRIIDAFTSASWPAGTWTIGGSPNAGTLLITPAQPRWTYATCTASVQAFHDYDVGKYIVIATGGVLEITTYVSADQVIAQILSPLIEFNVVPTAATVADGGWTIESRSWSATNGYPGVPMLFQSRLWWGGSPSFADFVWGSRSNDYENYARGPLDTDAVVYQLATSGVNMIRWMLPTSVRGFAIGTVGAELTLEGGTDAAITPSNVLVTERTRFGADFQVVALRISNQIVFLQRGGSRVRELAYKFNEDTYDSPDISILAEHLFRVRMVEAAYCSTPESVIFEVREDGVMNLCTYERGQNVVAWATAVTDRDDTWESVTPMPNACGTGDEVWVAVRRLTGGSDYWAADFWAENYWNADYWADGTEVQARYIEVFDGQMNTDSGLVYSGPLAGTFTGLGHLEGRDIRVIIEDGTEYDLNVSGGSFTLPNGVETTALEVGLPWVMTLVTVRPDISIPTGTTQGRRKHWNAVTVRVYCTTGDALLLDGEAMDYPEEMDPAVTHTPFSGDMRCKTEFGWDRDGFITVQRTNAKACTITGITGSLQVADD